MEPKSELGKLQHKFNFSGIGDNPIISDKELNSLCSQLGELCLYFKDRGDKSISFIFAMEEDAVQRMIWARQN